jgi:hypothetical protein
MQISGSGEEGSVAEMAGVSEHKIRQGTTPEGLGRRENETRHKLDFVPVWNRIHPTMPYNKSPAPR